jgi:hypothetical protein
MIGVGIWYANRIESKRRLETSVSKERTLKHVKSEEALPKETYNEYYAN